MNDLSVSHHQMPAYQLRYVWTGWPSKGMFPAEVPDEQFFRSLNASWESEGIRLLERYWLPEQIQLLFSTKPTVTPIFLASRAKGRLQYVLCKHLGKWIKFSRKVSLRTIGDTSRARVEAYITAQIKERDFSDPRFTEKLRQFTQFFPGVDLRKPKETRSGRYWYNLHIVLVTADRARIVSELVLQTLFSETIRSLSNQECELSTLAILPDHLHVALRGNIALSPADIAVKLQIDTEIALGRKKIWNQNYYTGTIGEYTMGSVRGSGKTKKSFSPAG
jgi:REP element-mobilizing transposase RayT